MTRYNVNIHNDENIVTLESLENGVVERPRIGGTGDIADIRQFALNLGGGEGALGLQKNLGDIILQVIFSLAGEKAAPVTFFNSTPAGTRAKRIIALRRIRLGLLATFSRAFDNLYLVL